MDVSLIIADTVDLLSRITGLELQAEDLTLPVVFLAALVCFVKAVLQILEVITIVSEQKKIKRTKIKRTKIKHHRTIYYEALQSFQKFKTQLDKKCFYISQIIQDCTDREFLSLSLNEEIGKVYQKLQSQRFRVAVVGEFNQGKSTILNALLGEEIQPVRDIPCSGAITVLRYGEQKRVICYYKDERQEEIPLELYQEKASIPKEAALGKITKELQNFEVSQISEIIFEHPNLELCQHGVEIVDSPGLNEHPERTEITQRLLQDTDVVIFVTNASRPLTQGEQELLESLKNQLNDNEQEPANNLFILVNFWDRLDSENSRQQVQKRIENLVRVQNPIISGENRIHFISAQATLDAILAGTENESLQSFSDFTQSLEQFLTQERGNLEIKKTTTAVHQLIQSGLEGLHQAENILDGKIKLSKAGKKQIFEQMGEISGREVKIKNFVKIELEDTLEQTTKSWKEWVKTIDERIFEESKKWEWISSLTKEELIQDYNNQFEDSLLKEINKWDQDFTKNILIEQIQDLNRMIENEIEEVRNNLTRLDSQLDTKIWPQFISTILGDLILDDLEINLTINYQDNQEDWVQSLMSGLGGGLTVSALVGLTGLGFIPVLIAGSVAGTTGSLFWHYSGLTKNQVKRKICEAGLKEFKKSQYKIFNKIRANIKSMYKIRVKLASNLIKQAILLYENLLAQQEKDYQKSLEQRQQEKVWIEQQRQRLEQVQEEIEAIVREVNP